MARTKKEQSIIKEQPKPKGILLNHNGKDLPAKSELRGRRLNQNIWTEETLADLGNELLDWLDESDTNIFFDEFLLKKGLWLDLLADYSAKFPSFKRLVRQAKKIQELKLVKFQLLQKGNPNLVIFLLKNWYKYQDKIEQIITDGKAPVTIVMNAANNKQNNVNLIAGKTPEQISNDITGSNSPDDNPDDKPSDYSDDSKIEDVPF